MKMKEVQLLGILAIIAGGIIILSLWGSEPESGGGQDGETSEQTVAESGTTGGSSDAVEDWMWLTEDQKQEAESSESDTLPGTASINVEGEEEVAEEEAPELTAVNADPLGLGVNEDLDTRLEESDPADIGMQEKESTTETASGTTSQSARQKTPEIYEVKKGDTLVNVSRKYYDSSSKWKRILRANSDILDRPEDLRPGMKLVIPSTTGEISRSAANDEPEEKPLLTGESEKEEKEEKTGEKRYYVARKNETLWAIAQRYYGKGSEYRKILKANQDQLDKPSDLKEGMRIVIPE